MRERRGVYRVLMGKPEGKVPPARTRCKWEYNIKKDLQEVGRGFGDWMELAQDRDMAGACEYGNELSGSIRCGEFLDYLQNQLASQEGLCSME
jgi:hypothetical protein